MNKKYSLCQIIRRAKFAGTEKHVYLLSKNLDKKTFHINVCTSEQGELVEKLQGKGIQVTVIPKSHSFFHFLKMILYLRKNKYDIVHCHSGGYACLAAKCAGIKNIIYTRHGLAVTEAELKQRSFLKKMRDFLVDKTITKYIALTKYDKKVMNQILNIDSKKIDIIWNGIDPSFTEELTTAKYTNPTIGIVGRLTRQKGISYLIKAVPKIVKKFSDLEVLIAGDGEDELMLKNLSKELGVLNKIKFLGYVKNGAEIINSMDIFVLPSLWEGFPYVLLEAMILKKPIVATDIYGIREIIDDNKDGLLIKPKSPDSIANAVIELLTNKKRARLLGELAYKKAIKFFTLERTVSKIQNLYCYFLKHK